MVDLDISYGIGTVSLSDILCFMDEENYNGQKRHAASPLEKVSNLENSNMDKTTEDIISDRVVPHKIHSHYKNSKSKPTSTDCMPKMSISRPKLGEPNKGRQRHHVLLEDEYWRLKLDMLGLKQIQERIDDVIKQETKPVEISAPKIQKKTKNFIRNRSKSRSKAQYHRPCSKEKPVTPEEKRLELEHFHHFLSSVKFDPRIKSAPPEGRGVVVNVRQKDTVKRTPDVRKVSIKNIP